MRAPLLLLGLVPVCGLLAAGCAGDSGDDASSDTSNLTFGSKPQTFDKDITIPAKSLPLSHTFTEPLTRFGVTVTPTLTPSGTFGLKDADVHIQAQYTTSPPKLIRLDVTTKGTWSVDGRIDLDVTAGADWKTQPVDFRKQFSLGTSIGGKAFEIAKLPLSTLTIPQTNIQLHVDLELAAACELEFDAELHAFAEVGVGGLASADVFYDSTAPSGKKVGFVLNGGLTKADQFHVTTPPHVAFKDNNKAQVTAKCGLQPSLNASASLNSGSDPSKVIADAGVKFVVEPYAEFDGKFNSPTDWSVDAKAGIQGTVAPFGDFFGMPFSSSADFDLFKFELAKASTTSQDQAAAPAQ
jgi:hypothetical protein